MYLPANFLTHNHRTDPQRPTYSTFRPFRHFSEIPQGTVKYRDSTNYHTQSPTKTICSEVFFWVCFGFLRFSFAITVLGCFVPHSRSIISLLRFRLFSPFFSLLRFRLFPSGFPFTISFISVWFLLSFFLSFLQIWFRILTVSDYVYAIWVRILSICSQVFSGSGMGNERLANVA